MSKNMAEKEMLDHLQVIVDHVDRVDLRDDGPRVHVGGVLPKRVPRLPPPGDHGRPVPGAGQVHLEAVVRTLVRSGSDNSPW